MLDWYEFDRLMMHCEFLASKGTLPWYMRKALSFNGCWRSKDGVEEPYCSYDRYTYELSNDQITSISKTYRSMCAQHEKRKSEQTQAA